MSRIAIPARFEYEYEYRPPRRTEYEYEKKNEQTGAPKSPPTSVSTVITRASASGFLVLSETVLVLSETVLVLSETVLVLDGCLNCGDADR
jgi:hypothetical protein